jgi:hypothetical protein
MSFQFENTVDVFERVPKFISPPVHRWIDLAAAAAFAVLGGIFLARGNRRVATPAFINAAAIMGVSSQTDYEGDGVKPISFKVHGLIDLLLATTATAEPLIFGFPDEGEAAFFYSGGPSVVGVVATTDWNASTRKTRAVRRAA